MPKVRDVLTKVYDLCKARGFVFERCLKYLPEGSTGLDYGPLGIEIKRNLLKEWWHEIVISRDNVDGIDLFLPHNQRIEQETNSTFLNQRQHLYNYLVHTHRYAGKLSKIQGNGSPVGLAQILNHSHCFDANINQFMFRSQGKEFYKLCFFCQPNEVSYWMDYWMRKRLSWWKKYADMPAEFSLGDEDYRKQFFQHSDEAFADTMAVEFNFPWGTEAIECISSYSDVRNLIENDEFQDGFLGVVIATLSVERGILAYLLDAFHENEYLDSQGVTARHSKLRLHPALAPIKVAVLSNNSANTDLGRVARQLATELRQAGIPSNYFEVNQSCDELDRYTWQQDEIGTPYAVTVQDSTLTNGVVTLRNRDTTLSEFLHISEILKTVQRHLDGF